MGKKRTRKEAHTEKSAHGKKRTRINPHWKKTHMYRQENTTRKIIFIKLIENEFNLPSVSFLRKLPSEKNGHSSFGSNFEEKRKKYFKMSYQTYICISNLSHRGFVFCL